ncbi:hypothetical protein RSAG8_10373, partial [Rhizoctonia solani AG-8 WAC10335]
MWTMSTAITERKPAETPYSRCSPIFQKFF